MKFAPPSTRDGAVNTHDHQDQENDTDNVW